MVYHYLVWIRSRLALIQRMPIELHDWQLEPRSLWCFCMSSPLIEYPWASSCSSWMFCNLCQHLWLLNCCHPLAKILLSKRSPGLELEWFHLQHPLNSQLLHPRRHHESSPVGRRQDRIIHLVDHRRNRSLFQPSIEICNCGSATSLQLHVNVATTTAWPIEACFCARWDYGVQWCELWVVSSKLW